MDAVIQLREWVILLREVSRVVIQADVTIQEDSTPPEDFQGNQWKAPTSLENELTALGKELTALEKDLAVWEKDLVAQVESQDEALEHQHVQELEPSHRKKFAEVCWIRMELRARDHLWMALVLSQSSQVTSCSHQQRLFRLMNIHITNE